MRNVLKYIVLIGILVGAIYLINDQRKKIAATRNDPNINRTKAYSIDQLQNRRNSIIDNIHETE